MKATMYVTYAARSLVRGGQRTVLAIFCVAVGVMAIVALQLVGVMIQHAFSENVRTANGGDIFVDLDNEPLPQANLSFFDKLQQERMITSYTPIFDAGGSSSTAAANHMKFLVVVVDPSSFPVASVSPPTFISPPSGTVAKLLTQNQGLVTQSLVDQYHLNLGSTLDVSTQSEQDERVFHIKIVGIVSDSGVIAQFGLSMLISKSTYQAARPGVPLWYDSLNIATATVAQTEQAVKAIRQQFPLSNPKTVADALKERQADAYTIQKFLEIIGLLALLIGGIGIVHTMRVLLFRRTVEIAMLKTFGYRRRNLYLLFGLEAGLLGFTGGVLGSVLAIGVSYSVRTLMEQIYQFSIPFMLEPLTMSGGIVIGVATALIFGLMPIVQAANIRPLNVLRELTEKDDPERIYVSITLLMVLVSLFCLMAMLILKDIALSIGAVLGTFALLGIVSLFFSLALYGVSRLPVPERLHVRHVALVLAGVVIALIVSVKSIVFGVLLLIVALMGLVVALLPRLWKVNTKMALRTIGRQRARTTTTMLALFVGVFTIGLILGLSQDLREQINGSLSKSQTYNVIALMSAADARTLQDKLGTIPGLSEVHSTVTTVAIPVAINGQPIEKELSLPGNRSLVLSQLASVEGYDITHSPFFGMKSDDIVQGRNLNATDAGKNDVLVNALLLSYGLKVGDTISYVSVDRKRSLTATVVGAYRAVGVVYNITHIESVLTTTEVVQSLGSTNASQTFYYMKVDPAKVGKALAAIGNIVPAANVQNESNIGDYIELYLSNSLLMLSLMAALSLLAAVIIIANAVALAMLERRRELGILKSVGYTSGTLLGEVLIENGIVGGLSGLLTMVVASLVMNLLGLVFFNISLSLSWLTVTEVIVGITLLSMIIALLVAWGSTRVRPLEVLRYE